jgi:hypothetical protein
MENAHLRAVLNPDANRARSETEQQMQALRGTSLFGGLRSSAFGLFYRSDV